MKDFLRPSGQIDVPPGPSFDALWAAFRRRWVVLQAVSWLLAWPLLAALKILAHPRPDASRTLVGVLVGLFGLTFWMTMLAAAAGMNGGTG